MDEVREGMRVRVELWEWRNHWHGPHARVLGVQPNDERFVRVLALTRNGVKDHGEKAGPEYPWVHRDYLVPA